MKKSFYTYFAIFLLSVGIWFYVTMSREYYYELKLPVTIISSKAKNKISDFIVSMVVLKVKGEGWKLLSLIYYSNKEYTINIDKDTNNIAFDLYDYFVNGDIFNTKIQILDVYPRTIRIRMEDIVEKKVVVVPDYFIQCEEGYGLIGTPVVSPDSIVIKGPASKVKKIYSIKTQLLSNTNVKDTFTQQVQLNFPKGITSDINEVIVAFNIQQYVDYELKNIQIKVKNSTKYFQVTLIPNAVDVKIRGGIKEITSYKDKISAYINIEDIINDTTDYIIPNISLPSNIEVIEIKPAKVKYLLRKF
ncbi:MAG TPA: CdaR family protein [Ignavibacteriales bacterium]|nr:CdaR family protein [Ignavibacteriales bacterium]